MIAAGRDIPPPPDGPGPFSLADADRARAVLTAVGFGEPEFVGVREPIFYGQDVVTAEAVVLGADGVAYRLAMWIVTAGLAGTLTSRSEVEIGVGLASAPVRGGSSAG